MFHWGEIGTSRLAGRPSSQPSHNTRLCFLDYWPPSSTHCKEPGRLGRWRCSGPCTVCHTTQICHHFLVSGGKQEEGVKQGQWTELLKRASVQNRTVRTWSSVGGAEGAGFGCLSLWFKDESQMPQKQQQPHFCSEWGPARKHREILFKFNSGLFTLCNEVIGLHMEDNVKFIAKQNKK